MHPVKQKKLFEIVEVTVVRWYYVESERWSHNYEFSTPTNAQTFIERAKMTDRNTGNNCIYETFTREIIR